MEKTTAASLRHIIPDSQLNEWEREELIEQLTVYDPRLRQAVLEQIAIIWPVSHSLCFAFIGQLRQGLDCLEEKQLPEWVKGILAAYEAGGLQAARHYMSDVENNFLCRLRGESGLLFAAARGKLAHYVRGISGRGLQIEAAPIVATDTATIFLPREISFYQDNSENFQVYKLLATYQWGFISRDLYCQKHGALSLPGKEAEGDDALERYFRSFGNQALAQDMYHLLQTVRVSGFLQAEFPGLMRDLRPFFALLRVSRPDFQTLSGVNYLFEQARHWLLGYLGDDRTINIDGHLAEILAAARRNEASSADLLAAAADWYRFCSADDQSYAPLPPLLFQGEFRPREAHGARLARRANARQKFIEALAAILPPASAPDSTESEEEEPQPPAANVVEKGATISPLPPAKAGKNEAEFPQTAEPRFICLDDERIALPEELRELAREIEEDLGGLPSFYISSASQKAGGRTSGRIKGPRQDDGQPLQGELLYNEWDFRRQGFRQDWCRLILKKVHPVKGTFVSSTLEKYRGQIMQLKRQFEMMRTQHLFVGRQRDGDDVDLDALIEAHADVRAGMVPSERLFIRLLRDKRDIAALFLVDMSSSTEGWVGTALKESLVLLSEALDSLGDRYAIYGFSGMRRTRSEVYHVKGFDEPYSEEIRGRIAAIAPIDYTRMGPPIRHFTGVLAKVDAKVRLLIILTDGKPEDYDDYKGEYAIEDTRHALIEAKAAGIHPFCITIDREAQDYMGHMLGEINYTFIDDVRKLPLRVPEIYRMLTS
ncbi:MAG: VWA domain-containing protein [Deltaproteobacteria bacterium]|nr:VWA domain-containing protein [Deltaproteobacteria bacterium]